MSNFICHKYWNIGKKRELLAQGIKHEFLEQNMVCGSLFNFFRFPCRAMTLALGSVKIPQLLAPSFLIQVILLHLKCTVLTPGSITSLPVSFHSCKCFLTTPHPQHTHTHTHTLSCEYVLSCFFGNFSQELCIKFQNSYIYSIYT